MSRLFFPLVLMTASSLLAQGLAEKEQYQPIIDSKPFGDMAETVTTDTATLAEQQKQKEEIAQKFRMCGITDLPDGSRKIAFLDETAGAMASYLLGEGETQNGFTLIVADYEREYATLSKDGLTFTLGLGKGLIDTPPEMDEPAPKPVVKAAAPASRPQTAKAETAPAPKKAVKEGSFRSRLLKRRAEQQAAEKSEKVALQNRVAEMEAERVKAERRAQIERIKQGLAPTQPIQLTPEEDAELEAAGVFKTEPECYQPPQPLEEEQEPLLKFRMVAIDFVPTV
jgi:hypothetical protein